MMSSETTRQVSADIVLLVLLMHSLADCCLALTWTGWLGDAVGNTLGKYSLELYVYNTVPNLIRAEI